MIGAIGSIGNPGRIGGIGARRSGLYDWSQHFASGQQGYVLMPGRLDTLFQDSAGSTPVTAAGQTVGRMLDLSGRGNHFTQATFGSRPAYQVDGSNLGHLLFDGVNDFMSSGTITPGSDKVCVVLGIRKLSDAALAVAVEASANSQINNGAFAVFAPGGVNPSYTLRSTGTSTVVRVGFGFPAPITNVVTMISDISGDQLIMRVNGAQVFLEPLDQGTGNYLAYQHFMGMRAGTSLPFNGRIYGAFVRYGALPSASELAQIEAAMNSATGAF